MSKVWRNGVIRDATVEEQKEIDDRQAKAVSEKPARKLGKIRHIRNTKLQETDYLSNSDVTMPDNIKTWRQSLRDIPQDYTTETKYDELLARNEQGKLTNSIWTIPS
jgi:hypothetical protein